MNNKYSQKLNKPKCYKSVHLKKSEDGNKRILPKIGRNDPCYCGSGKKFKKCCVDFRGFVTTYRESIKGVKGGNCNRRECQKPGAFWFNHSTEKYYCKSCAIILNKANKKESEEIFGHDLCTYEPGEENG